MTGLEGLFVDFAVSVLASSAWAGVAKVRDDLRNESGSAAQREQELDAYNFRNARVLLKKRRKDLAILAAQLPGYRDALQIGGHVPLLCRESWIPAQPIPLPPPNSRLSDDTHRMQTTIVRTEAGDDAAQALPGTVVQASRAIMPVLPGGDGRPAADYVAAIESIPGERPSAWRDCPSYRLLRLACDGGAHRLEFVPSSYFDYQRSSEVLCYELALRIWTDELPHDAFKHEKSIAALADRLRVRQAVGEWWDLNRRHAIAGINNLTILRNGDRFRFLMMQRGMGTASLHRANVRTTNAEMLGAVASAMGAIHVIPAGEFQPSTSSPARFSEECTIWCTLMREFAEEILLLREAKSQSVRVFDFAETIPFSVMIDAASAAQARWRTYYLGTAIDPLSLKPEILTVTVLDTGELRRMYEALSRMKAYDRYPAARAQVAKILNGEQIVPERNSEGAIFAFNIGGEELTPSNLVDYMTDKTTLPAAMGCLALSLRHLDELLAS